MHYLIGLIALLMFSDRSATSDMRMLDATCNIYCNNYRLSQNEHEWIVDLSGTFMIEVPFVAEPQSNWTWKWYYKRSGGTWYSFATTTGSTDYTTLDDVVGYTGLAKVELYIDGNLEDVSSDIPVPCNY